MLKFFANHGCLFCLVWIIVCLAISAFVVCGLIWFICLLFGLMFSWKIALGIWLVLVILSLVFGG